MNIGTVDIFELKLQKAQQNFPSDDKIEIQYQTRTNWVGILSWLLPFGFIILFWLYILRRTGGGASGSGTGSSLFNFGKSNARLMEKGSTSSATFKDIAGLKEAKTEIMEAGDMPALERNYLDKHDALNRTARVLTENGLSFIAAKNLHR